MPESHPTKQTEPPASTATPHQRRVRYSGKHPRHFAEKYKEHNPERYAADVQKVVESGKTPAGSHRPICVNEILEVLAPKPGEIAVDATLGYGGHALEILRAIQPGGKLYALDVDPIELPRTEARLRAAGFSEKALIVQRTNFAALPQFLAGENVSGVDIVLADLGVSSMQIDDPERGFTFKFDGPLDLRMNPNRGRPASALLADANESELAKLFAINSDEPHAEAIAQAIVQARAQSPIATTKTLANVIADALSQKRIEREASGDNIRRVFQALRIAVNDELNVLDTFLRNLPMCLNPGARVAILTFHSGEDRRVKQSFLNGERSGIYSMVARDIIRPGSEEVRSNPRASSAKLRWAIKA